MSRVRRTAAFVAFWHFIRGQSRPGAPSLATRINAFPRLVGAVMSGRWDGLGRGRLALMGMAVFYLLQPNPSHPLVTWLAGSALDATERFVVWEDTQPRVVESHVITEK